MIRLHPSTLELAARTVIGILEEPCLLQTEAATSKSHDMRRVCRLCWVSNARGRQACYILMSSEAPCPSSRCQSSWRSHNTGQGEHSCLFHCASHVWHVYTLQRKYTRHFVPPHMTYSDHRVISSPKESVLS